jgi:hypothetical protein
MSIAEAWEKQEVHDISNLALAKRGILTAFGCMGLAEQARKNVTAK